MYSASNQRKICATYDRVQVNCPRFPKHSMERFLNPSQLQVDTPMQASILVLMSSPPPIATLNSSPRQGRTGKYKYSALALSAVSVSSPPPSSPSSLRAPFDSTVGSLPRADLPRPSSTLLPLGAAPRRSRLARVKAEKMGRGTYGTDRLLARRIDVGSGELGRTVSLPHHRIAPLSFERPLPRRRCYHFCRPPTFQSTPPPVDHAIVFASRSSRGGRDEPLRMDGLRSSTDRRTPHAPPPPPTPPPKDHGAKTKKCGGLGTLGPLARRGWSQSSSPPARLDVLFSAPTLAPTPTRHPTPTGTGFFRALGHPTPARHPTPTRHPSPQGTDARKHPSRQGTDARRHLPRLSVPPPPPLRSAALPLPPRCSALAGAAVYPLFKDRRPHSNPTPARHNLCFCLVTTTRYLGSHSRNRRPPGNPTPARHDPCSLSGSVFASACFASPSSEPYASALARCPQGNLTPTRQRLRSSFAPSDDNLRPRVPVCFSVLLVPRFLYPALTAPTPARQPDNASSNSHRPFEIRVPVYCSVHLPTTQFLHPAFTAPTPTWHPTPARHPTPTRQTARALLKLERKLLSVGLRGRFL
ncbi:hypothetical protein DFH06DRAFT_1305017 [Mycena polygramma]|nr:hypothetical protein DFH06DRAFT_1305017 [Mycena polygramma]